MFSADIQFWGLEFSDNVGRALIIGVIVLLTWLAQRVVRIVLFRFLRSFLQTINLVHKVDSGWDERLSQTLTTPIRLLVITVGLRIALLFINFADEPVTVENRLAVSLIYVAVGWAIYRIMRLVSQDYVERVAKGQFSIDETLVRFLRQLASAALIVFVFVSIMHQWGQNVGTLVAGFGIISLAVALAAQDALGNIIAYFAILADAPFKVGNFIALDANLMGTVEEISFRSTRIRTKDHALMIVPNRIIAGANITNWTRIRKRRLEIQFTLPSSPSAEDVRLIIDEVKQLCSSHPLASRDRVVVFLGKLGEATLQITITCSVRVASWDDFQDTKLAIQLDVLDLLKKRGD